MTRLAWSKHGTFVIDQISPEDAQSSMLFYKQPLQFRISSMRLCLEFISIRGGGGRIQLQLSTPLSSCKCRSLKDLVWYIVPYQKLSRNVQTWDVVCTKVLNNLMSSSLFRNYDIIYNFRTKIWTEFIFLPAFLF